MSVLLQFPIPSVRSFIHRTLYSAPHIRCLRPLTLPMQILVRYNSSKSDNDDKPRTFDFIDDGRPFPDTNRAYSTTNYEAREILRKYHGYEAFRGNQEAVIARLAEPDSRVIYTMKTGGGKSIIYQILARLIPEKGIVVVVEPLVSLLRDQVKAAKEFGIAAAGIEGTMSEDDMNKVYKELKDGRIRMIFVTAERIQTSKFFSAISRQKVLLLVHDEVHTIPQDGTTYRPALLYLPSYYEKFMPERILLTTATVTEQQIEDIACAFRVSEDGMFRSSIFRPNLTLRVEACHEKQKYNKLKKYISEVKGCQIVYAFSRTGVEELAMYLKADFPDRIVHPYHARMKSRERNSIQDEFMGGKTENMLIVATSAFGMGLNKPNVRQVIHHSVPSSAAEYLQQVGRAGRDGQLSRCIALLSSDGKRASESMIRKRRPLREDIRTWLFTICTQDFWKNGKSRPVNIWNQADSLGIDVEVLEQLYALLEYNPSTRYIHRSSSSPRVYKFRSEKCPVIQARYTGPEAEVILSSAAPKENNNYSVWLQKLCSETHLLYVDLENELKDWHDDRLINIKFTGYDVTFELLRSLPANPAEIDALTDILYRELTRRQKATLDDMNDLLGILNPESTKCIHAQLEEKYGFMAPGTKLGRCGTSCSPCLRTDIESDTASKSSTHSSSLRSCKNLTDEETASIFKPIPTGPARHRRYWQKRFLSETEQNKMKGVYEEVVDRCRPDRSLYYEDAEFLTNYAYGVNMPRLTQWRNRGRRTPLFGTIADWPYEELHEAFKLFIDARREDGS